MVNADADIGLIGLAVMGQNLALNIADHGFTIAVYNRTTEKMTSFIDDARRRQPSAGRLIGCRELSDLVSVLNCPRKVIIMVQAGTATDKVIDSLADLLEAGDIIIDGGNALWTDTIRREQQLAGRGILFVGSGVSGGEVGARFGPSLMPGCSKEAWKQIRPIWTAIAAKVDPKTGRPIELNTPGEMVETGEPCTTWIGENGAGHYVKMVHNGIEYIDMQLICEAYMLMKQLLGLKGDDLSEIFTEWNKGVLSSYLVEITADILSQRDPRNSRRFFVDVVRDAAGQKGTGRWTSQSALDLGVPANAMAEAVFARMISAIHDERAGASKQLRGPKKTFRGGKARTIGAIHDALYCSKICAYAQGFQLMAAAQKEYGWQLDFASLARIWRGGCIIRAAFLQKITDAYLRDSNLANLMLDRYFKRALHVGQENWRKVVSLASEHGIASPAFMSALAYFDGYRSKRLPANLLQAQRDYFGAHTYERVDEKPGLFFHLDWPHPDRPELKA